MVVAERWWSQRSWLICLTPTLLFALRSLLVLSPSPAALASCRHSSATGPWLSSAWKALPLDGCKVDSSQIILFLMKPSLSSLLKILSCSPTTLAPPQVMQEKFLEPCYHWFMTTLILQPIRTDLLPSREFQHSGFGLWSTKPSAYS